MGIERGANEQRLSSILETIPDIIYRLDTRGKITFVNDAVKKYGYSIKELVGTSILEIVHPEDKKRAANRINERRTGDRSTKSLEIRLFRNKHAIDPSKAISRNVENETNFMVSAKGLYDCETHETKGFMGTQGIDRDVTERKRMERALRESERKFRSVAQSANDAIISSNNTGNIVFWNIAAQKMFGYIEEEIINQPLTILMLLESNRIVYP